MTISDLFLKILKDWKFSRIVSWLINSVPVCPGTSEIQKIQVFIQYKKKFFNYSFDYWLG